MRLRNLAAGVALLASGLVVGPQSADAAPVYPKCSFGVPAKLSLTASHQWADFLIGRDCPSSTRDANWITVRPDGSSYGVGCSREYQSFCSFTVEWTPIGVPLRWNPDGYAKDAKGHKVADLLPATSLTKCGAAISLTGVRKGTKTTLSARATYYSTKTKGFTRHHGRVLFQKRDLGSNTWTDLGWAYPNTKTGAASYTITTNRSRDYRVYVPSSNTVWYAYSATKRV